PVRRPRRMRVPPKPFANLAGLAACDKHYPDFSEDARGNLSAVERDCRVLRSMVYGDDSRLLLLKCFSRSETDRVKRCDQQKDNRNSALHLTSSPKISCGSPGPERHQESTLLRFAIDCDRLEGCSREVGGPQTASKRDSIRLRSIANNYKPVYKVPSGPVCL